MSVIFNTVDGVHKDTAKWLLTFTPITAVIALVLTIRPSIEAVGAAGPRAWIRQFPAATVAIVMTALATVVLVVLCRSVLLATATEWSTLRRDVEWWSGAFSKHAVGMPLFPSSSDFDDAELRALTEQATPAEHTALAATTLRVQALSEEMNAQARLTKFSWAYGVCMAVIVAGLATATFSLSVTPEAVTKPTAASLYLPGDGAANRFTEATGCVSVQGTTAIAVRGLWSNPTLRLIGPGCRDAEWTPTSGVLVTAR
jgi:hypothetical protein